LASQPLSCEFALRGCAGWIAALRPEDYIITLMTEVDVLKTATGNGRYSNFVNLISVSHPIPSLDGVNATVELYSSAGTDPTTPPLYTFDIGANFKLDEHTILDVGLNLDLNEGCTEGTSVYGDFVAVLIFPLPVCEYQQPL
jgi:hypothetical protein